VLAHKSQATTTPVVVAAEQWYCVPSAAAQLFSYPIRCDSPTQHNTAPPPSSPAAARSDKETKRCRRARPSARAFYGGGGGDTGRTRARVPRARARLLVLLCPSRKGVREQSRRPAPAASAAARARARGVPRRARPASRARARGPWGRGAARRSAAQRDATLLPVPAWPRSATLRALPACLPAADDDACIGMAYGPCGLRRHAWQHEARAAAGWSTVE
jgi:hypothetical protein